MDDTYPNLSGKTSKNDHREPLRWSPRMKHRDIEVRGNIMSRTVSTVNRMVCCLSKIVSSGELNRWSIRIRAKQYGMVIGLCQI